MSYILILGIAVVGWRSAFNIMDRTIYPNEPVKADIVCVIFGLCGTLLMLTLQCHLATISRKLHQTSHWCVRRFYENFVYLIIFVFLTTLWRGTWNLNTRYFLPDLPLGGWVNFCIGLVLMISTQTMSYVAPFGCITDGAEEDGGAFFPIRYLQVYLKDHHCFTSQVCKMFADDLSITN